MTENKTSKQQVSHSSLESKNPSGFPEERLNEIAQRARLNGVISLWELTQIIAADKSYDDILFELWEIFGLNKISNRMPQLEYKDGRLDKDGNLKFFEDRVGAWWWLWARLAAVTEVEEYCFKSLPPIVHLLPLYEPKGGELRRVNIGEERKESHYVKLEDLAKCLKHIEKIHNLNIPLPGRLFTDQERKLETAEKTDLRGFSIPCKPGTTWEEISIFLIADDTVRVETPQGKGRYTYHELGMNDKRAGDRPTLIWELFKLFARNEGLISSQNPTYVSRLPDTAKRLNKHLQELFGISESIFTGHYRTEKGYRTKINFYDRTS